MLDVSIRSGKPIDPSTMLSLLLGLGWRVLRGPLGALLGALFEGVVWVPPILG